MREIVIDTETNGLDALGGNHRVVEIGAVELINRSPTARTFHSYVYPSAISFDCPPAGAAQS
jgi:DNA polymerase III subunit epsilon